MLQICSEYLVQICTGCFHVLLVIQHPWTEMVGWRHHLGIWVYCKWRVQFGLGGRDDASYQCDLEWAMWQHVAKHLWTSTLLCLAGQKPPADAKKRAHWCMHLSAASSQWFRIPDVRCWVAVEDGWGTRPVQILWCLNWQSGVMSKLHETQLICPYTSTH